MPYLMTRPTMNDWKHEFSCLICLDIPHDPHVCSKCLKTFCHVCVETAYNRFNANSCPHCRAVMPLEQFVRAAVINRMNEILKSAIPACSLHRDQRLEIYCRDCKQEACHSCWTTTHGLHFVGPVRRDGDYEPYPTASASDAAPTASASDAADLAAAVTAINAATVAALSEAAPSSSD